MLAPSTYQFTRACINYIPKPKLVLSLPVIINYVSEITGIPKVHIKSQSRKGEYVLARQIYCYIACNHTTCNLSMIASEVNGSDHSMCIHSRNKIEGYMDNNKLIRDTVNQIVRELSVKYITNA